MCVISAIHVLSRQILPPEKREKRIVDASVKCFLNTYIVYMVNIVGTISLYPVIYLRKLMPLNFDGHVVELELFTCICWDLRFLTCYSVLLVLSDNT